MQTYLQRFSMVIVLLGIVLGLRVGTAVADGAGNTRIRFMHALVNGPNVDVFVDDSRQASNVAYARFSGYFNVAPGGHRLKVFTTGTSDLLIERDFNYETGKDYTLFVMGLDGDRRLEQFENQISVPEAGKAAVRFVNASPNAPAAKVCITGTEDCRMQNAPFAVATSYVLFDANRYNFDIRLMDNNQIVFQRSDLQFNSQVVYTLVAVGIHQNQPPLDLITIIDTDSNIPPPKDGPITGAFLTPVMGLLLTGVALVLVSLGWFVWRQVRRWRAVR
jgi:hypothetical protein